MGHDREFGEFIVGQGLRTPIEVEDDRRGRTLIETLRDEGGG